MNLDRIRKLAGIKTDSVQAPSQIRENNVPEETTVEVLNESSNLDFTDQKTDNLIALEEAIEANLRQNITLSESTAEAKEDIDALSLTRVGTVADLGKTVFVVYEDLDSELWFQHTDDPSVITETSLSMDDLKKFHSSEKIDMYEGAKNKKPDADGDGVPDWADKKPGKDDHECDDDCDDDCEDAIKAHEKRMHKGKKLKEAEDFEDRGMTSQDWADSDAAGKEYMQKLRNKLKSLDKDSKEYKDTKAKLDKAENEEQH